MTLTEKELELLLCAAIAYQEEGSPYENGGRLGAIAGAIFDEAMANGRVVITVARTYTQDPK